jgi:hypothetical protein
VRNNTLFISGTPFYYFFKYNISEYSFREKINQEIEKKDSDVRKLGMTLSDQDSLSEISILKEINEEFKITYKDVNYLNEYDSLLAKVALDKKYGMSVYLGRLKSILASYKIFNSEKEVIYLENLSTTLSRNPSLFKNINPAVWDAGVKTMRFAALFRYCKKNFPEEWMKLLDTIDKVTISPEVDTPSIMHYK